MATLEEIAALPISEEGKTIVVAVLALDDHNKKTLAKVLTPMLRTTNAAALQFGAMISALVQMTGIDEALFVDTACRVLQNISIPEMNADEEHEVRMQADKGIREFFG